MTTLSFRMNLFGHPATALIVDGVQGPTLYDDTLEVAVIGDRNCARCGKRPEKDGRDPCLPALPGVKAACCGHGTGAGYVLFENGMMIRGWWHHVDLESAMATFSRRNLTNDAAPPRT